MSATHPIAVDGAVVERCAWRVDVTQTDRERAECLASALLSGASDFEIAQQFAEHRTAGQAELACEVSRLRAALTAILSAPMIDHQNSNRSVYGIARAALALATQDASDAA
jgi:hypothetical protein